VTGTLMKMEINNNKKKYNNGESFSEIEIK
jgi:hypothetical protein